MSELHESQLYIDGKLRPAKDGRRYQNIAPATEQVAGHAADASPADMDAAIAAARHAFDETDWPTNLDLRIRCLEQLRDRLKESADANRPLVSAETGAPIGMTYSIQLDTPIAFMDWTIECARRYPFTRELGTANTMGTPSRRLVWKEAAGVVGAITPWNVPVQINLAKCVAALGAGCTVVLKAAPDTPWGATLIGEAAAKTDMPPGAFNVITGSDKAGLGEMLTTDPRVDVISFTGSTATGRRIMAAASGTVKRVFLELGGKSANIVLDDADLSRSLHSGLAVCYHAGQGCAIPTRILLPKSRYEEAIGILKMLFENFPYGDPNAMDQIMGPLISKVQQERVLNYIKIGREEGARLVTGGGVPARLPKGHYVEPTLFADVDSKMRIAQEEIFGPVLVAIPYVDDDDAVRIANDSIYGLNGQIHSADVNRALSVGRRIRAGMVNINSANAFAADSPFGGYKQSGIGREMGVEGFEEYLQTKAIGVPA